MHIRAKWEANRVSSNPQNFIMLGDQMLDIITKVEPLLSTGFSAHCSCDQCRSVRELLSVIRGANNEGSDMVQVQCRVKASKFRLRLICLSETDVDLRQCRACNGCATIAAMVAVCNRCIRIAGSEITSPNHRGLT
jgi:hypothetical protein